MAGHETLCPLGDRERQRERERRGGKGTLALTAVLEQTDGYWEQREHQVMEWGAGVRDRSSRRHWRTTWHKDG